MKIVLLGMGFISWGGGLDCLKLYIKALLRKKKTKNLEIYLLIPQYSGMSSEDKQAIINSVSSNEENVDVIVFYTHTKVGLIDALKQIQADVVIPSIHSLGKDFPYPWVGYLYDFQHKYYPDFFTLTDIENRNQAFSVMLNGAKTVIVNALDVKNDILKYYPGAKAQVYDLPFAPIANKEWFSDSDNNIVERYSLQKKFFLMSNQFWVHKSHGTAFEALAILQNKGIDDYEIVCTGNTGDHRFPNYFNELQQKIAQLGLINKIKILGYIPKEDQIQIMRKSMGVLQPTLFEGGPGGGATYNAVALGIPVIISDIPVNREIVADDIFFFKTKSSADMADKMLNLIHKQENNEFIKVSPEFLMDKGDARLQILGDRLLEAIDYVMSGSR